jgi:hypothetical protein
MKRHSGILLLLLGGSLFAQYPGGYPPGGYPPGGYPPGGRYPGGYPGGGVGLPIPSRGKKVPPKKDSAQPLPSFSGSLKSLDAKSLVVDLDDNRTLNFDRNGKTKFVDVKPADLKPGDHVTVEASEDAEGFLTAVNVYLDKLDKRGKEKTSTASGPVPAPAHTEVKPPAAEAAAAAAPPPADDDSAKTVEDRDPDRPVLRRGVPPKRAPSSAPAEGDEPVLAAASVPASVPPPASVAAPPAAAAAPAGEPAEDPLIEKARAAVTSFTETLPNYVCQEVISRYDSNTLKPDWRPLDVISSDVVYEDGRESYRNLKVGGKAVNKSIEELGGSWSTGEFGTLMRSLFSPLSAARFRRFRDSTAAGRAAVVYSFEVDRENSNWLVRVASQSIEPAYRGRVWIDKETARVLRIEMETVSLPEAFPLEKVESTADYQFVRLAAASQYLLPVNAEILSCQRGSNYCSRNHIDFRNYHKYAGESTITFEGK